jgi:hypothetical protein
MVYSLPLLGDARRQNREDQVMTDDKSAAEKAKAEADRIKAEHEAAKADQERIKDNQGPREGGGGKDE